MTKPLFCGGHPDEISLTPEEEKAIAALKRLEKKWPESLWLLANEGGSLSIMRKTEEGRVAIDYGVDAAYEADRVYIQSDGGEWA